MQVRRDIQTGLLIEHHHEVPQAIDSSMQLFHRLFPYIRAVLAALGFYVVIITLDLDSYAACVCQAEGHPLLEVPSEKSSQHPYTGPVSQLAKQF
jgi:hypothetical protein